MLHPLDTRRSRPHPDLIAACLAGCADAVYNGRMCANYTPSTRRQLEQHFGVAAPDADYKAESFPGYMAPFIRTPGPDAAMGDRACALGMFGIVPAWAQTRLARQTYNARSETASSKPSFRSAFKRGQFCIIPVASFYEPSYESGRPVRYEIAAADGSPLGIAGLWEYKPDGGSGLPLLSFSMLTVNADGHPLMQRFHKPDDAKRMVVILPPERYDEWLHCPPGQSADLLTRYPAELLSARPAPRGSAARTQAALPGL